MRFRVAMLVVVGFALAAPAVLQADSLIVGYNNTTCSCLYAETPQAAQFTLTSAFDITHIDVTLYSGGTMTGNFSLQDALSNPGHVFFSGSLTPAAGITTESLNLNTVLGAGTYYLVVQFNGGFGGWMDSTGVQTSNGGNGPNGDWQFGSIDTNGNPLNNPQWSFWSDATAPKFCGPGAGADCNAPTYAVYGNAAVPEPGSMALLGTGLIAVAGALRRRLIG